MNAPSDPFHKHPELRDLIADPEASFFRNLSLEALEGMMVQHGLPGGWWYSDEVREGLRATALTGRMGQDLWVFAYGSLMWDPGIRFSEVRRAKIDGYERKFILKDVRGGRGTQEKPGLFAALDTGECCEGLAFKIDASDLDAETQILWQREQIEPSYTPVFVRADFGAETACALAFVADHSVDLIDLSLSVDAQAAYIATAAGVLGTSADYLRGIVAKLRQLGIADPDTFALLEAVESHIATLSDET